MSDNDEIVLTARIGALKIEMRVDSFSTADEFAWTLAKFMTSIGYHPENVRDAFAEAAREIGD